MQRLFIGRFESIHPRLHKALNRSRNAVQITVPTAPQELLQKQRVPFGSLDAGEGKRLADIAVLAREGERVLLAEGSEVDCNQRRGACPAAPRRVELVSFRA